MTALLTRMRVALLVMMLLGVAASAAIIGSWIVVGREFGEFWLMATLLLGAFSFAGLLCVNLLCKDRRDGVAWVGFIASALAFLIWQPVGWIELYMWRSGINMQTYIAAGTVLTAVAGWCAVYAAFKAHTWVNLAGRIAMVATLGLAAAVGVMITIAVIAEPWNEVFWSIFGITCLLAVCGLLTSMALALMSRVRTTGTETMSGKVIIDMTCPRCASSQTLRTGMSRCSSCGLRFEIIVEEPMCVCGYQFYQLTGTTCPECGRQIPEKDRWAVHAPIPPSSKG